jgi:hypothetical protein
MLGHFDSLVERNGLVVVRSGPDKPPSGGCELPPAVLSPPPCHLHRDNRPRSHPPHFASTVLTTPNHPSRSKCGGVPQPSTVRTCHFAQRQEYSPASGHSYCPSTHIELLKVDVFGNSASTLSTMRAGEQVPRHAGTLDAKTQPPLAVREGSMGLSRLHQPVYRGALARPAASKAIAHR